jgi:arylformamidase
VWNSPKFIGDSPHLTFDAAEWLLNGGAPIIGLDLPAFDDPARYEGIIQKLFSKGVLLLGPLIDIRQTKPRRLLLMAFPLKIKGLCGTRCRAVLVSEIKEQFHLFNRMDVG